MSDTPIKPLLISKDHAAKLIDTSVEYVESLIRDGLVRAVKTGRVTRIRYEDVETLPDRLPTVRYRQKEATS